MAAPVRLMGNLSPCSCSQEPAERTCHWLPAELIAGFLALPPPQSPAQKSTAHSPPILQEAARRRGQPHPEPCLPGLGVLAAVGARNPQPCQVPGKGPSWSSGRVRPPDTWAVRQRSHQERAGPTLGPLQTPSPYSPVTSRVPVAHPSPTKISGAPSPVLAHLDPRAAPVLSPGPHVPRGQGMPPHFPQK